MADGALVVPGEGEEFGARVAAWVRRVEAAGRRERRRGRRERGMTTAEAVMELVRAQEAQTEILRRIVSVLPSSSDFC